jgi:hypothetical protein
MIYSYGLTGFIKAVCFGRRKDGTVSLEDLLQALSGYTNLAKVLNPKHSITVFGKQHALWVWLEQ